MDLIIIGLGGFFGAISRYGIHLLEKSFSVTRFPLGTLLINLVGCFLTGILLTKFQQSSALSRELHLFLLVGFLSSFTTFSTFSAETFHLLKTGAFLFAGLSIMMNLAFGLGALWLGHITITHFTRA